MDRLSHTVQLAGSKVRFETSDERAAALLHRRFQGFSSSAEAPHLHLRWRTTPGDEFHFDFDIEAGLGLLECAPASGNLDVAVRQLLPHLIDGAVFHAALLSDGDSAFLCCGDSGAGKSTLCALLPDHALSDELAAVVSGGVGHALPFWRARVGSAPLAGAFLLAHDTEHHRVRRDPGTAFRELSHHVLWPLGDEIAMHRCLETVGSIAQTVPVWRLGFRPEPGVWATITDRS